MKGFWVTWRAEELLCHQNEALMGKSCLNRGKGQFCRGKVELV